MAIEIATAYISLLPSTAKLAPAIRSEFGKAETLAQQSGERAGNGFGTKFKSSLTKWAKGGLLAGAAGVGLLGAAGLKTAADLEQSKIGFETMLGSAKEANSFLAQIKKTAAQTPFELPGLTQSAQKMLAFGFAAKDVIPTLTTLGDAASGLGKGAAGLDQIVNAVGQIQAKGKVQGDELLQLTEAGIPALKILANGFGTTTAEMQKMVTKGVVPADKAIPLLLKGLKNGTKGQAGETAKFGGLMEKQSKSLTGLFSNLKDKVFLGLADAITPLIPTIKVGLQGAIDGVGPALKTVSSALATTIGFFRSLSGSGAQSSEQFRQFKETASAVWKSVVGIFQSSISIVRSLWSAFGPAITQNLRATFSNVLTITRGAFTVIQGVFKVFSALLKGDWSGVWAGIRQIFSGVVTVLVGLVRQLWNTIRLVFRAGGVAVRELFSGLWSAVRSLVASGASAVVNAVKGIPGKLGALAGRFGSAGKSLIQSFVNGMKNASGIVSGIAGKVWDAVKGMINSAIRKINNALNFKISLPGPDVHVTAGRIPLLAKGGVVDKATLAIIGEAGPEAVVPLDRYNSMREQSAVIQASAPASTSTASAPGAPRRSEFTITNWKTGEGYFREIAEDTYNGEDAFASQRRRMA